MGNDVSLSHEISNLMVALMREYTGRGPTRARTYMQDDLITIVVRDALTRGERNLVHAGRSDHVLQTRRYYEETMRQQVTAGVEELTGRRVIAFISGQHLDPDVAVETLIMQPREHADHPETGRSRDDDAAVRRG